MSITNEYIIPNEIKKMINKIILIKFKENLDKIYNINTNDNNKVLHHDNDYHLMVGTGNFENAMISSMPMKVMEHYYSLQWYDLDWFGAELISMLTENGLINEFNVEYENKRCGWYN